MTASTTRTTETADEAAIDLERSLPNNLEAERSVLGAIVASNGLWGKVASILTRDDFFRASHRLIFDAMVQLNEYARPIDFVTLKDALTVRGDLDDVGGPAYITSLTDGVPKSTNVDHYADIVKEHKRLRDIILSANRTLGRAYAIDPSSAIIDDGVRNLLKINAVTDKQATSIGTAVSQYISGFDGATDGVSGHKLGFVDVDQFFAGGLSRQLVIVAARPGAGKSTFCMNVAQSLAARGTPVGIFSLEMGAESLAETALARTATVDLQRLKSRLLSDRDWSHVAYAVETLTPLPIYIVEHVRTLTQFDAWCRRLRDEHHVQVIVLDYLQLMGDVQTPNRQQEIAFLSRSIKAIATEMDLLMLIVSQLNRASEERKDKRPHMSDLRESGCLEQDADVVLLIFRSDAYDPNHDDAGIAEIIVAKNRLGPVGVARLAFLKEQLRFADLAADA